MFKLYTSEIAESLAKSIEWFEVKATEKDYVIKDIVMTTNSTDRHNEVVLQEGIDLTEFKKNPVALIDHNYQLNAIAWVWQNIRQEDGKTIGDCRLVDTEAGNLVKTLHMAGAIKDVSIGFIAKEREGNVITKAELIECSFVVVGSNRGAKIKEIFGVDYQKLKDAGLIVEEEEENEEKKEITQKDLEEIRNDIADIKTFIKTLVDGKTTPQDELDKKELVQGAVRALNEALSGWKKR